MNPIRLTEIAYSSEWFLAKLYPSLSHEEIKNLFQLVSISGRQKDIPAVLKRIDEIRELKKQERGNANDYAKRNNSAETESLNSIGERLSSGNLGYFKFESMDDQVIIQNEMFEKSDAIYICTNNATHANIIETARKMRKPMLCEKPLCVLLGSRENKGKADRTQLSLLERMSQNLYGDEIIVDAEHYSYKPSSMNFYKNIEKLLHGRQIVEIHGEIIEHDSPSKDRVIKLLNQESRTGLLTDTGVHLLSFVSNLGYLSKPIKAEHGIFNGTCRETCQKVSYNVETATKATYELSADEETKNEYIRNGTKFHLTVEKFGQYSGMEKSKKLILTLSDKSTLTINFDDKSGNLYENIQNENGAKANINHLLSPGINSSEYINILKEFERTIRNPDQRALTDFRNSLRTMNAIYETYSKAPIIDPNNITLNYDHI